MDTSDGLCYGDRGYYYLLTSGESSLKDMYDVLKPIARIERALPVADEVVFRYIWPSGTIII